MIKHNKSSTKKMNKDNIYRKAPPVIAGKDENWIDDGDLWFSRYDSRSGHL